MDSRFALPTGTVLDGAYRIVRVVGTGGFGITYEAEDIALRTTVALKEYYPDEFGDRDARMSVRPKSERHKQTFEWGRSNFLKEARTLARFEHPSIVRVSRVFEAHSTAYMVMSFERGQSLEAWLRGLGRPPAQDELDRIVAPLLDALQLMHAADFLHRDIAPDNIIVRADGSPVLLDFGASRRAVAEMSRAMTGIVKAGYSPHEQYASDGRLQGPWSDLYALGGTLYRAVTGSAPEEATLRVDEDRMAPAALAAKGSYRPGFLAGIDACLEVRHANRPRSVAQLRPMLFAPAPSCSRAGRPAASPRDAEPAAPVRRTPPSPPRASPARRWVAVAAAMLVIAAGAYGGYEFTRWQRLQHEGAAADARTRQTAAQKADLDAQRRRQQEADTAQRQATLDAERQRQEAAEAVARADAERRRQQEERAAAEAEARRKAQAEAEEARKEEERRRIASREDPTTKAPAPPPASSEPVQPPGRLIKMRAKVGSLPNDARKGWLGFSMEPLELPLALALGLAQRRRRARPRCAGRQSRGAERHPLRRCRRRPERPARREHEGASPAPVVDGTGQRGRAWRSGASATTPATSWRRCAGWPTAATPTSCIAWAGCTRPASASPATRRRPCAGTARVRTPATWTPWPRSPSRCSTDAASRWTGRRVCAC